MRKIVLLLMMMVLGVTAFGQLRGGVKSFLGKKAPKIVVERWLGEKPDTTGKFVLLEFWKVNCNPCRASIPHLNELQAKFSSEVTIVSLCSDDEEKIAGMKNYIRDENGKTIQIEKPKMNYPVAIDTKKTTMKEYELIFVPYAVLIDPKGFVRWEGNPLKVTEEVIMGVISKYKESAGITEKKVSFKKKKPCKP